MKKQLLFLIATCLAFQASTAQLFEKEKLANSVDNIDKKLLSWGYFLGFNSYDFKFQYNQDLDDILVQRNAGFHVGLVGDMRINDFLNLRLEPGVFFTKRTLIYNPSNFNTMTNPSVINSNSDLIRDVKSTYIHVPLLLKASAKRINNFKPFLVGGFSTALNLSSNENNQADNSSGEFRMKSSAFFYEIGFGIDFYLQWFKFSPSIRGVFAINDELVRDNVPNSPWTGNVNTMQTRAVFVTFTFQ